MYVSQTFPVSVLTSSNDCFEGDQYTEMIPDDSGKGVLYVEQLTAFQMKRSTRDAQARTFEGNVRFVGVINHQLLTVEGVAPLATGERLAMELIFRVLREGQYHSARWNASPFVFRFVRPRLVVPDERIFSRYTYNAQINPTAFFLSPMSTFAFDVAIVGEIGPDCLPPLVLGEPRADC